LTFTESSRPTRRHASGGGKGAGTTEPPWEHAYYTLLPPFREGGKEGSHDLAILLVAPPLV
jgi:hypothetical protein